MLLFFAFIAASGGDARGAAFLLFLHWIFS